MGAVQDHNPNSRLIAHHVQPAFSLRRITGEFRTGLYVSGGDFGRAIAFDAGAR